MSPSKVRRNFKERIYEYSNHRSFLNSYFRYRKQLNPRFTLASWARMIELSSGPHLGRILNGERCPSDRTTEKLCSYFEFNKKESEYFENLIMLEKTKQDTRLSELITNRLRTLRPSKDFKRLDHDIFEVLSDWYYMVIFVMVDQKDFNEDPHWVAEKLRFDISPDQAKEALEKLISVGLLQRSPRSGKLKKSNPRLITPPTETAEAYKINHEQGLENARVALRHFPRDERKFMSGCFNIKKTDYEKIENEITEFRNMLFEKYAQSEADGLVQLQIQLYPHV